MSLKEACEDAIAVGAARQVGSGIELVIPIDIRKLQRVEDSYAKALDARLKIRDEKERVAWIELRTKHLLF